jgi:hypothetical protein
VVDCISRQRQEDRYLSVVSLGEIERGIETTGVATFNPWQTTAVG